jgi:phosphatidyl-myo-inositol dimannoside synthase
MRLALVAQDFPPSHGGIQTYAFELARAWSKQCPEFCVIAPSAPNAASWDRQCGFEVRRVALGSDAFFVTVSTELARLGPAWHTFHTQWFSVPAALTLRRARRLREVFVAAHGRELLLEPWNCTPFTHDCYDMLRRRALKHAKHVFAVSHYTAGLASELGVSSAQLSVHPNGTDAEHFTPAKRAKATAGAPIFLSVARLVPRKGVELVVRAFRAVLDIAPGAQLVIVGDGPERPRLARAIAELELGASVSLAGALDATALLACYHSADVFVLPARSIEPDVEGFGIVYLEASACGLPVIGPDCGGPRDAIEDGTTGLLVDPLDQRDLEQAMCRLATNPLLRARLGRQGRQRVVDRFRWCQVADGILQRIAAQ